MAVWSRASANVSTSAFIYDEDGQLLTATFMDYSMPRAAEIPNFHFETRNVPSTTNAMGMKGAGEAGTIGACPAVMNAVGDALRREYGIANIDSPALPQTVWQCDPDSKGLDLACVFHGGFPAHHHARAGRSFHSRHRLGLWIPRRACLCAWPLGWQQCCRPGSCQRPCRNPVFNSLAADGSAVRLHCLSFYLAAKIAFSGSKVAFIHSEVPPGFFGGLALQAINPKAYVVHTTLFSGFAFMSQNLPLEIIIKFVIMNLVWIPIHLAWLWAGVALNRLDLAPAKQRAINVTMALAMIGVVALALSLPFLNSTLK